VDAGILSSYTAGLEKLEDPIAVELEFEDPPVPVEMEEADPLPLSGAPFALWIHDEDLVLESSPLSSLAPQALLAPIPGAIWEEQFFSEAKQDFLSSAIADGVARAEKHFNLVSGTSSSDDLEEALVSGAQASGVSRIVAMRPFTGPLADALPGIAARLQENGVSLHLLRREEDLDVMNRATAGFFGFWKKTAKLREPVPV
ncbi:MAG: hypothetical protein AAGF67_14795, partial [Verrucomicrobiota bacterium]